MIDPSGERGLVLVVDDDADITRFIEINLRLEGLDVVVSNDGLEALAQIERTRPDLVLLDVNMPRLDGITLCRQIRADPSSAATPVIMLTAKGFSADKVVGLSAGADDYIVKPFDTLELVARVRSTLRRNKEIRGVSPLTGLPGNHRILEEIHARVNGDAPYAVCYADLDNFKSFNDAYGFLRGDQVLSLVARALAEALVEAAAPAPFLGHIGGDDFVIVCTPEQAEPLACRVIAIFDDAIAGLYDPVDAEREYLEVTDRRGEPHRYPLVTVSIGITTSLHRTFEDHREVISVATEMKSVAKREPGSAVAFDRRSDPA